MKIIIFKCANIFYRNLFKKNQTSKQTGKKTDKY